MKSSIVLGLQFGDEGKGLTTSYLASQSDNPLVIRFNGGHQSGHTVVRNGTRHVFSSFGSGTLHGANTYISRFCTFYPLAAYNELYALEKKGGCAPILYVDPLAMVTTPYDQLANEMCDMHKNNGTVGVGFGYTIKRHEAYYKLFAQDLLNPVIASAKLKNIATYYKGLGFTFYAGKLEQKLSLWYSSIATMLSNKSLRIFQPTFDLYDHLIFEGAQGILLDMDHGFFPNVTRSNTTGKNAIELIKEIGADAPHIYYVSRLYQTRHGNGFMTHENIRVPLINNENETNKAGGFQGDFRIAPLDMDLINHAMQCDALYCNDPFVVKNLVLTCKDQMIDADHILYFHNNRQEGGGISDIVSKLTFRPSWVFTSSGPSCDSIRNVGAMKS